MGRRPVAVNRFHLSAARALTAGAGGERARHEGASGSRSGGERAAMAYAYLFKYIIIGDTGERRGRRGGAAPGAGGGRSGEPGRALRSHFRSAGVVDVVALREEEAPPASALGPARALGLPLGRAAPGGRGPCTRPGSPTAASRPG